jgi:hypothetical protein
VLHGATVGALHVWAVVVCGPSFVCALLTHLIVLARGVVEQAYSAGDNFGGALSLEMPVLVTACARFEDLVFYKHPYLAISTIQPDSFLDHEGAYVSVRVIELKGDVLAILGVGWASPDLENAVDPRVGFQQVVKNVLRRLRSE